MMTVFASGPLDGTVVNFVVNIPQIKDDQRLFSHPWGSKEVDEGVFLLQLWFLVNVTGLVRQ